MKLYLIKNSSYEDRKVIADNMEEALYKYRKYLDTAISFDYSVDNIFGDITECIYMGKYQDEDIIR